MLSIKLVAGGGRGLKYTCGSSLVALSAKVCVCSMFAGMVDLLRLIAVGIVSYRVVGIVFHVWRYAGLTTERRGRAREGCRASVVW